MNMIRSFRVNSPTPLRVMGHRQATAEAGNLPSTAVACAARLASARPSKSALRRGLAVALGLVVVFGAGAPALAQSASASAAQASSQTLDPRFDDAMQDYERNHWPQAFDALVQLAEQGHVEAARLVVQMHWQGLRLYGQRFSLTPLQLQRVCQQNRLPNCPA